MVQGKKRSVRTSKAKAEKSESAPVHIPLKYCPECIVPSELVCKYPHTQKYILITGETVVFRFGMTCDNRNNQFSDLLDSESKRIYGLSYEVMRNGWMYRLGSLSEFWTCMKPIKINDKT